MPSNRKPISLFLFTILLPIYLQISSITSKFTDPTPVLAPWPHQFHAILFMNNSGALQKVDLWYDWPNVRNFNIIQHQRGKLKYDLEWNNGTTPTRNARSCISPLAFFAPIGSTVRSTLARNTSMGFCVMCGLKSASFGTMKMLSLRDLFIGSFTQGSLHVMTFEVGAVLEDSKWQAPVYCFRKEKEERASLESVITDSSSGKLIREVSSTSMRQ